VQKCVTAGAESVPPAPWVNMSVGDDVGEGAEYELHWIGDLVWSESMERVEKGHVESVG
jgi:hypothetical protein